MEDLRKKILEAYEDSRGYEARKAAEFNKAYEVRRAAAELQEAKLKVLQDTIGNYGTLEYADLEDLIDPDNQNWNDYEYKVPGDLFSRQGRVGAASPIGLFIEQIRHAKNIDDVKKQLELWNSYKPLDLSHNGESYVNHLIYGLNKASDYGGSRPVFPTTDEPDPVQTTAGGTQGVVAVGGTQGTQTGGTGTDGTGTQGTQAGNTGGGTPSTQGMKTGSTGSAQTGGTGTGSTGGMRAGNSGGIGGGTYASSGVSKGGTKTIGYEYDPNPGNVSLAYAMRNAPEQERRNALIDKWNRENGRSGSTGYATGEGMLTSGSNGTYATGEGIKDANGNVLTNPGGDWEYQYALKNPQYGLGMMGKMSDAQKNYLQAVSNDMGYKYNFTGATRFV